MVKFRPLRADEVDLRVDRYTSRGAVLLCYKDARCDMRILDETVGAENWQREHYECKGNLFCRVGIKTDDGWAWKADCGTESYTEKEKGEYSMNDLFHGRYFVKETKAPEGFVLDTGVYEVMIDTDGKTYEVENKAGVGFINDAMRGNLKIVKTSSDGKVKGFAFRITGANGYDIILETNDKGEIFIDGLRIGDYTISEVSNSASSMYVIPADKKATVKLGSTTIVEMHNVLRDTPKTGDTTNLPLLYALAGLSAVGIAVCGVIGFKKKKKEDRN